MSARDILARARLVFWDFDGVVKDSVDVKTRAFVQLFEGYGTAVAARVREHHLANGGMSRFDKLPLYLRFAGEAPTRERVEALGDRFAALVRRAVVEAPWVPGVEAYLRTNAQRQRFVLVSATPQAEIESIVDEVGLAGVFERIVGAPAPKTEAIRETLRESRLPAADCLMIGDATADLEAAAANGVPFLLRRHDTNADLCRTWEGHSIEDLASI